MIDTEIDPPEWDGPSKSQLKRDSQALQDMGAQLVDMPEGKLQKFDLPENLRDAIYEARRLKSREAKRRHLQYIGKLMRDCRYRFNHSHSREDGPSVADLSSAFCPTRGLARSVDKSGLTSNRRLYSTLPTGRPPTAAQFAEASQSRKGKQQAAGSSAQVIYLLTRDKRVIKKITLKPMMLSDRHFSSQALDAIEINLSHNHSNTIIH